MKNDMEFMLGPSGYPLGTAESDRVGWPGQVLKAANSGWPGATCLPALPAPPVPPALALTPEWRGNACGSTLEGHFSRLSAMSGGWCSHLLSDYYVRDVLQASADI